MTLKEIAKRAGVSTATVSLVLNDSPKISNPTKAKIREIIRETGYRSNRLAGSLRRSKTGLIGILVEDITVWHTALIIDGMNQYAEEHGCNTILSNLRLANKIDSHFNEISLYQKDIDQAVETLLSLQVDGIVYIGMHDRLIRNVMPKSDKPVVFCYCYTSEGEESSIRYDNEKTLRLLTEEIIRRGHKRIAAIHGKEDSEPAQLRKRGFHTAMQEAGLAVLKHWDERGDWNFQGGRDAAIRLLCRNPGETVRTVLPPDERPSAIVCMNDEMAVGVYNAAAELHLRIPEDLSVSGFDNADFAQHVTPALMTVDRPLHKMGYRALDLLLHKIQRKDDSATNVVYPCTILPGQSVQTI